MGVLAAQTPPASLAVFDALADGKVFSNVIERGNPFGRLGQEAQHWSARCVGPAS